MTSIIDKELLRKSLIDLTETEPDFVRKLMIEVDADLKKQRIKRVEEIISESFTQYDDVYKALA